MHEMTSQLLSPDMPASKRINSLWHEYEEQKTKEARFVKDLDRLEMALQACEYEKGVVAATAMRTCSIRRLTFASHYSLRPQVPEDAILS